MAPLAAQCSDYMAVMALSTETVFQVQANPANASLNSNGPNCPTTAADSAFGVLRDAADRLAATLPAGRRPPSLMMALHVWSMAHGIASLFVRPGPSRRRLPMTAEDLLEAGVLIYLQSLGLAGGQEA